MATVNLGNIKLNWKGAYNSSTAYIVDDVVSYNGSSYVCILASTGNLPTVTTYWNQMSAKGTDGTDISTTLTTQGDILYRDGSGLARLGAGTSGYYLKTQGTGANPVWAEAGGGDYVKLASGTQTSAAGSLVIDGYFTSDYHVYKLFIVDWNPSSADHFAMRLNTGGSQNSNSVYRYNGVNIYKDSSSTSQGSTGGNWDNDRFRTAADDYNTTRGNGMEFTLYDPLDTGDKDMFVDFSINWRRNDNATWQRGVGGFTTDFGTTAVTGVTIFPNGGNNQTVQHWALYGLKF